MTVATENRMPTHVIFILMYGCPMLGTNFFKNHMIFAHRVILYFMNIDYLFSLWFSKVFDIIHFSYDLQRFAPVASYISTGVRILRFLVSLFLLSIFFLGYLFLDIE